MALEQDTENSGCGPYVVPEAVSDHGSIVAWDAVFKTISATPAAGDVSIEMAAVTADSDASLLSHVTALVNKAFTDAEQGIFLPSYRRTNLFEVARLIRQGELALALSAGSTSSSSQGAGDTSVRGGREVIGCAYIRKLAPSLGNFGMLALDARFRGSGLGRALVRFAEEHCCELGCTTMQLELLVPSSFEHAGKLRMQAWYLRMGYRIVRLAALSTTTRPWCRS